MIEAEAPAPRRLRLTKCVIVLLFPLRLIDESARLLVKDDGKVMGKYKLHLAPHLQNVSRGTRNKFQ